MPRSVRARAREIERAHQKLEHKLQRAPTDEEMADELDMDVQDFQDAILQISNSSIAALDELWTISDSSGDSVSLLDTIADDSAPDPAAALRPERPARPRRRRDLAACPSARSS